MEGNGQPVIAADGKKVDEISSFNLKWLVSTVLAIWPWMLASVVIALIAGNLYLRYTDPQFRSQAEMLIADSKGGSSGGGGDIADMLKLNNRKINIDNEIEIIKSRTMMQKVVRELHLNIKYTVSGRVKTTDLYGITQPFEFVLKEGPETAYGVKVTILGPNELELTEGNGKVTRAKWNDEIVLSHGASAGNVVYLAKTKNFMTSGTYNVQVGTAEDAAYWYNPVNVFPPGRNASFITISHVDKIPQRSNDIIDKLMEVYARNNVQLRNRISDSTMSFITSRIGIVDSELTSIEKTIDTFKQKHGIADMSAQAEQLITANTNTMQSLAQQEYQLAVIESFSNYMSKEIEKDDRLIILPPSLSENMVLTSLMEKYTTLKTEIENSLIANTPGNPITRTMIKQRDEIRQNIIASLASAKKELQLKVDKTKKELGLIQGDIRQVPRIERLAIDFGRKQNIKQELFLFLLKKREDASIEKAATVSDATPIDPAISVGKVLPNGPRVMMVAFLIGIIIPFGIILLRRALNVKIINKSDIMTVTSVPIIGEIGNNLDGEAVAVKKNSRTIVAEQFRALRTNLQYLLTDKKDKVLMITSSMSGEGKSFIAVNLSITLAMTGKKVVLLELDLRKPKISKMLGLDNSTGFSTFSIGKAGYDDIFVPSGAEPNLYILPSGPIPPNPSELILLHRTEELFQYLRANFDYVIVDTSPVGLVTDAQLLYRYADTTLYIVRQGHTYKQQLNIPNELYNSGKIPRLSLIINDVVANRGFAYGYGYEEAYGYGYGYGYGSYGGAYGSGYYTDPQKKSIFKKKKKSSES